MHELDESRLRRSCDRAADGYAEADFFCREVRGRLLERLTLITLQPATVVDLGGGTGESMDLLRALYPGAAAHQPRLVARDAAPRCRQG